ncbi:hypothetical protein J6590_059883 [Homalodisca vitripennis]|nr:hypothetical protein J6590_059883 [Homalodisca vitripennis]
MKLFLIAVSVFLLSLNGSEAVIKVVASPVVFTNNAGGGADELQVPQNSEASKLFHAGGQVTAAWWVPFDNIGDLPAIHRIQTVPAGPNVNLVVYGLSGQRNARVRITIYAELYVVPSRFSPARSYASTVQINAAKQHRHRT